MGQEDKLEGGCLCGAVRFNASPENKRFGACHCDMCRRWTAGAYLSIACGDSVEIQDETSIGVYSSSKWAERHFCSKCGTSLWYKLKNSSDCYVSIELFDKTEGFDFASQIYIDCKPDYYTFSNETKNMTGAEVEAAFATLNSGETNV
ncbi:MAG: GFA family protein [Devosiaceae bacterium]|nr:GFA family protein [Devosiaceae bacterium]